MTYQPDPSLSFQAFLDQQEDAAAEHTDDWANRQLAKLRSLQQRIAANDTFADRELDRVEAWRRDVNRPLVEEADRIHDALRGYAWDEREAGRKTIRLPNGELQTSNAGNMWRFDESFTEWAREHHPEWVKTTYTVSRTAAKAGLDLDSEGLAFDPTSGEVVPGASAEPQAPHFTIKIKEG